MSRPSSEFSRRREQESKLAEGKTATATGVRQTRVPVTGGQQEQERQQRATSRIAAASPNFNAGRRHLHRLPGVTLGPSSRPAATFAATTRSAPGGGATSSSVGPGRPPVGAGPGLWREFEAGAPATRLAGAGGRQQAPNDASLVHGTSRREVEARAAVMHLLFRTAEEAQPSVTSTQSFAELESVAMRLTVGAGPGEKVLPLEESRDSPSKVETLDALAARRQRPAVPFLDEQPASHSASAAVQLTSFELAAADRDLPGYDSTGSEDADARIAEIHQVAGGRTAALKGKRALSFMASPSSSGSEQLHGAGLDDPFSFFEERLRAELDFDGPIDESSDPHAAAARACWVECEKCGHARSLDGVQVFHEFEEGVPGTPGDDAEALISFKKKAFAQAAVGAVIGILLSVSLYTGGKVDLGLSLARLVWRSFAGSTQVL